MIVRLHKVFSLAGALIGVHCTHGLNRTGYLICKYMVQRNGVSAEKAIEGEHIYFRFTSLFQEPFLFQFTCIIMMLFKNVV